MLYKFIPITRQFSSRNLKTFKETKWLIPEGNDVNLMVHQCVAGDKVPVILKQSDIATWYSCGPTVYDSPHIGHASCYVKLDIIQRILSKFLNVKLITVMGITDIDDKIIRKATETKTDFRTISKQYEHEFWMDMLKLEVNKPLIVTRVSEYIPHIVKFIEKLLESGYAYSVVDGSVYFDTSKYGNYGKLKKMQDNFEPKSVGKRSSTDFALWKGHKPGEPFWETKWGQGRPGWHIECSAMVSELFGPSVDFHAGGIDLQFPHHENEECQSCAYHNTKQWTNYWIHVGHLHSKSDVKMSKSLKNTVSVGEMLQKYSAATFRMACLMSNYRNTMEYSEELMENMNTILNKFKFFLTDCNAYVNDKSKGPGVYNESLIEELKKVETIVNDALRNDFDTAKCMNTMIVLMKDVTKVMHESEQFYPVPISLISEFINDVLCKFGLNLKEDSQDSSTPNELMDILIEFRRTVRSNALSTKNKDLLKACDIVRDKLKSINIQVNDSNSGSTWVRVK